MFPYPRGALSFHQQLENKVDTSPHAPNKATHTLTHRFNFAEEDCKGFVVILSYAALGKTALGPSI